MTLYDTIVVGGGPAGLIPEVWIAGDLRPMTQQVAVAMGTGNIAAVMIDQRLWRQDIA